MLGIEGLTVAELMPAFWLIVGVIFAVSEALTVGLVTIWFTGGAVAALIAALLGAGIPVQVVLFLVVSIGLLLTTRKIFVNKLKTGRTKTNVDALVGEEAKVLTDIKPFEPGSVKLKGQEWTAVAKDDDLTIASGEIVKVVAIDGVKAVVKPQGK
ncbi:MAG: NfeD family protein [Firmicutes bacterium]|nr:NfeD family protein [Bacillota bacterium]